LYKIKGSTGVMGFDSFESCYPDKVLRAEMGCIPEI